MKFCIRPIFFVAAALVATVPSCGKKAEPPAKSEAAEPAKAAEAAKTPEGAKAPEAAAAAVAAAPAAPAAPSVAPAGLDEKVMALVTKGDGPSLVEAVGIGLPFLVTAKAAKGSYADDQKIVGATTYAFNHWFEFVVDASKPEADRTSARKALILKLGRALGDVTHSALHGAIGPKAVALLALDPDARRYYLSKVAARTDKEILNIDVQVIDGLKPALTEALPKGAELPNACAELSTEVMRSTNSRDVEEAISSMWQSSDCMTKLTAPQRDAAAKLLDEHFERMTAPARDSSIRAYAQMCAKKELLAQLELLKTSTKDDKAYLIELGTAQAGRLKCD